MLMYSAMFCGREQCPAREMLYVSVMQLSAEPRIGTIARHSIRMLCSNTLLMNMRMSRSIT